MRAPELPAAPEFLTVLPELVLTAGGLLLLAMALAASRGARRPIRAGMLAVLSVGAAALALLVPARIASGRQGVPFLLEPDRPAHQTLLSLAGTVVTDGMALAFKALLLLGALLTVLLAARGEENASQAERFALLLFTTLAGLLLAGAADLLLLYLALEGLNLGSAALIAHRNPRAGAADAARRYLLYSAVTTAVLLYGFSLLYGLTGGTNLYPAPGREGSLHASLRQLAPDARPALLVALGLVLVGLGAKAAIAPFHAGVPAISAGAPTPLLAWLPLTGQVAGLAALSRMLAGLLPAREWAGGLAVLAAATMLLGALAALSQPNFRALLAWHGISHIGHALVGLAAWGRLLQAGHAPGPWQIYAAPIYLATYIFSVLGVMAVALACGEEEDADELEACAGLAQHSPFLAGLMGFFLLSLAGLPPTAGFLGKVVVCGAAIATPGLWWLALVALAATVLGLVPCLRILQAIYLQPTTRPPLRVGREAGLPATLVLAAVGTAALFLGAGAFLRLLQSQLPP